MEKEGRRGIILKRTLNSNPHEVFCNRNLTVKGLPALRENIHPVALWIEVGEQQFFAIGLRCDPTRLLEYGILRFPEGGPWISSESSHRGRLADRARSL
jgi:hypothetical protein